MLTCTFYLRSSSTLRPPTPAPTTTGFPTGLFLSKLSPIKDHPPRLQDNPASARLLGPPRTFPIFARSDGKKTRSDRSQNRKVPMINVNVNFLLSNLLMFHSTCQIRGLEETREPYLFLRGWKGKGSKILIVTRFLLDISHTVPTVLLFSTSSAWTDVTPFWNQRSSLNVSSQPRRPKPIRITVYDYTSIQCFHVLRLSMENEIHEPVRVIALGLITPSSDQPLSDVTPHKTLAIGHRLGHGSINELVSPRRRSKVPEKIVIGSSYHPH